ncbi:hypothetical protein HP398_05175 [Brevibacillus sp. HB1.4B]|uniref:hypothetical protein n=1 Tax=Brevibacillus sp. HB1.4B TaxID=2738845 RepID=UPI00156AC9BA|nr:hypothetical protein [Brevibacillus sp. HB1.4B]NRS15825.1 hypothetical protein [Brevibacillus sp. HB1.4B]
MKKTNDLLTITGGKDKKKIKVTRKAFEVVYEPLGYKLEDDPAADEETLVNTDGNSDK